MAKQQVKKAEGQVDRRGDGEPTRARRVFLPLADIVETKSDIVLLAEMPGVAPDGVDITLEKRVLTIHGTASLHEHPGYRQLYAEYSEGDYERSFTLSEEIDQDRIEASLESGVLKVVLPKAAPAKARKIELSAS